MNETTTKPNSKYQTLKPEANKSLSNISATQDLSLFISNNTSEKNKFKYRNLLDNLPAGAYMCNAEGLITYYNKKAVSIWGRKPKLNDPVDRFCGSFKLFIKGSPIKHDECWMALALKKVKGFNEKEILIEQPNGQRLTALANANPIVNEFGELIGAVNVLVDITEINDIQKELKSAYDEMEDRVRQRTLELKIMVENLKKEILERKQAEQKLKLANEKIKETQNELIHSEKLASLGRFSSGIAHEIRNPLANISALAQLMTKKKMDIGSKKYLKYILINSDIANKIIKDILSFASVSSMELKRSDIGKIMEDLYNLVKQRCVKNKIQIIKKIEKNLPPVMLNVEKLQSSFLNLISNAIEAMKGGGKLKINVVSDKNAKHVLISFEDTGEGISKENINKVFEPFFTTKAEGTGLGLCTTYHVIKAHSGKVAVASKTGKGTKITVTLPFNSE